MEIIWIMSLAAVHIGCFLAGARVARWSGTKRTVREAGPYKGDGQGGYPAGTVGESEPHKEDIHQRRLRDLWHNIECYDGTAAGQREVH